MRSHATRAFKSSSFIFAYQATAIRPPRGMAVPTCHYRVDQVAAAIAQCVGGCWVGKANRESNGGSECAAAPRTIHDVSPALWTKYRNRTEVQAYLPGAH